MSGLKEWAEITGLVLLGLAGAVVAIFVVLLWATLLGLIVAAPFAGFAATLVWALRMMGMLG